MTGVEFPPASRLAQALDKDRPPAEWIRSLRARFPTEAAIDRLLTRKMERRSGPGYTPVPLAALVAGVEALLRAQLEGPFKLGEARWLSGGASKLQMAFTLEWERPGAGREKTPMVLRMEPADSIVTTSRLREFQLLRAFEGVVPVPRVHWCDEQADYLPYPALVYEFSEGVTKPSSAAGGVSGTGIRFPAELRARLAPQFIGHLAAIHGRDYRTADLSAFDVPAAGTQCAQWGVNWWDRVWEEDCDEDVPLMRLASAWLRRNLPRLEQPCIVHSDYRAGNFLFTEHDGRITALLDWELGRIGDRHQDLAWTTNRAFGSMDEANRNFLVCGLLPESQFFEAYEQASGHRMNPKSLHWHKVYNNYWLAILLLATSYRIARNGKTHQDVLVTWLISLGYMVMDDMRQQIERGC
ncbi:MAG: phosphotransferase family protein [Nevskia sp.]|nr:phosphotransferase family protein [Nevskia sp.]